MLLFLLEIGDSLDSFVQRLITHCRKPDIQSEYRTRIVAEDKEYTTSIKNVVEDIRLHIGDIIVEENPCLAAFSNCFVPTRPISTNALCHDASNGEKHCKAFTLLMLVDILKRPPECIESFDTECLMKNNENKKTLLRFLKYIVFDDIQDDEQPFLDNEKICEDPLKTIRTDGFIGLNLTKMIKEVEFIKSKCLNRTAYSDYAEYINQINNDECLRALEECSKGKTFHLQHDKFYKMKFSIYRKYTKLSQYL